MEKTPGIFDRTIAWIYTVFIAFMLILVLCAGFVEYSMKINFPWPNILALIVGVCALSPVFFICRRITKHEISLKTYYSIILSLSLILILFIWLMTTHYAFETGWDTGAIQNLARGTGTYALSTYPNNVLFVCFVILQYKIAGLLGISQPYFLELALQCAGYGMACFAVFLCAENLTEHKRRSVSIFCWIVCIALVGFSPWVVIPYTDSVALSILPWLLYCLLKFRRSRRPLLWLGLFSFGSVFGYYIRPQMVILMIAGVLSMLIHLLDRTLGLKEFLKRAAIFIMCAAAAFGLARTARSLCNLPAEDRFGIAHFLMMGLNTETDGVYSAEDVNFSGRYDTVKERNAADWEEAGERLKEMGVSGLAEHLLKKSLNNYADGTFAWSCEGSFFLDTGAYVKNPSPFLTSLYYEDGSNYDVYRQWMKCLWLAVLFFSLFAFGKNSSAPLRENAVIGLTLLGLSLFELLFESRARYLFCYAPFYILLCGIGADSLLQSVRNIFTKSPVREVQPASH